MKLQHFPVRPDLEKLMREAEELLHAARAGDVVALATFHNYLPTPSGAGSWQLADAQLALARGYGIPSWDRLVLACRMTDAIWRDDVDAVRALVRDHPALLHEDARGVRGNWGPPMSYAANLGHDRIVALLFGLGAQDLQHAFDRACLQGRLDTARKLYDLGARPLAGAIMGPCETHSSDGLGLLLSLGAEVVDESGDRLAPMAMILQTYGRHPAGKHACLELLAAHGVELPDTATMAVHRGRIDLLERHLLRDPLLFTRTFRHEDIYPPSLGCHDDHSLALHGTPLAGATLLHLCVDNDEMDIARWMIAHGAPVNARAAIDADGFGGHTALFGCVVSQPFRVALRKDDAFARLLLDHGADPNARASLRKRLRFVADETPREYRNVTPIAWGLQFHDQDWVSPAVLALIAARGGRP